MVAHLLRPWRGTGYRHIPDGSAYDVLDTRFAHLARDSRWNEPGQPTLYIASDLGVAVAEFGRHLRDDRAIGGDVPRRVQARAVFRLTLVLAAVLDLRDDAARQAIGLGDGLERFLEVPVARAAATFIRRTTTAEGILVPSVAFLDDPQRWNLGLFLEKLPADLHALISPVRDSTLRIE